MLKVAQLLHMELGSPYFKIQYVLHAVRKNSVSVTDKHWIHFWH